MLTETPGEASRSLKHVVQRNCHERQACDRQTRHLDAQKRNREHEHAREEREIRAQLHRLQEERRFITDRDHFYGELILFKNCKHLVLHQCNAVY